MSVEEPDRQARSAMRAVVHLSYGPPSELRLAKVPEPVAGRGEVLVRVRATSVNAYDWHIARADPFLVRLVVGLFRPRRTVLGVDVAGTVVAVGQDVSRLQVGDEVFGDLSMPGGRGGGFAELVVAPERALAVKPSAITFEQAAAAPMAAVTALQALRAARALEPGRRVLVHGASGGVGTFAIQIARAYGAEVTAACSASKAEVARELGAARVVDYAEEDVLACGESWDAILGVGGSRRLVDYRAALASGGTYVMVGGSNRQIFEASLWGWLRSTRERKLSALAAKPSPQDLELVAELMREGKVRAVIDRRYPLAQAPEAIEYVAQGRARGKVVVVM